MNLTLFSSSTSSFLQALPGSGLAAFLAAILGACVGCFLNRIVTRLPKMMERELANFLATEANDPVPHPDRFDLFLPWRKALPTFLPRGTVECVTAVLFAGVIWILGATPLGATALLLVSALIVLSAIDAETKLLPDSITLPLIWCGILANFSGGFTSLYNSVLGAVAGYIILWCLFWAFKIFTGKEGMGYGDFKLLSALGAWFGIASLPSILILSAGVGAVIGLCMMVAMKKGRDFQIPFGPYLSGAGLLYLYFPEIVLKGTGFLIS